MDTDDLTNSIKSRTSDPKAAPIKRLNPTGTDVLKRRGYYPPLGDLTYYYDSMGNPTTSLIQDVALGPNGTYTLLDIRKNRLFTYSDDGELLYAFSAQGSQAGNTENPSSLVYKGTDILLLDKENATITVFELTEYGSLIDQAYYYYNNYDYDKSVEMWNKVLQENANFDIAYDGIGNAYLRTEQYKEAVDYFRYSNNKASYSEALSEYRTDLIEHYLLLFVLIIVVILFALVKLLGWVGKRNKLEKYKDKREGLLNSFLYGFYIMLHPFDGFWDIKHEKRGNMKAANIIVALTAVSFILKKLLTNYLFNPNYGYDVSVISEILTVVIPFLLWVVSNWAVTTLMSGEGSMKDVYKFTAYALLPLAIFTLIQIPLSYVMVLEEQMYLTFFNTLGILWTAWLIFVANTQTHRYTVGKSLISMILTVVGIAIIIFVSLVVFTTYQKIYSFFEDIFKEITYRF